VSCGGREITGKSGLVKAVKLYPAGATTNAQAGVTDLFGKCMPVLEEMVKQGLPLLVKILFWTVFCVNSTIFPNQWKRKASLGISVNQWACSSVSCEDSILMRGDLYSCDSF
jgi:hypothetical protein